MVYGIDQRGTNCGSSQPTTTSPGCVARKAAASTSQRSCGVPLLMAQSKGCVTLVTTSQIVLPARSLLMLPVTCGGIVAVVGGLSFFQFVLKPTIVKNAISAAFAPKPTSVVAEEAKVEQWPPQLSVIGTLRAFQGIIVAPQVAGVVSAIHFQSSDDVAAGARLVQSAKTVWRESELMLKGKEPLPSEYGLLQSGQALFTYLHLAAGRELAGVLIKKRVLGIAYETVEGPDAGLPLLKPMSQIAGRLSIQIGAYFLQSQNGGSGVLLGGIPGTMPGRSAIPKAM